MQRGREQHPVMHSRPSRGGPESYSRPGALRSATEPIDDTSTGKLTEGVLAAFAQFDSACRSDRTRAGIKARWRSPLCLPGADRLPECAARDGRKLDAESGTAFPPFAGPT
jgi:hypothetical protein